MRTLIEVTRHIALLSRLGHGPSDSLRATAADVPWLRPTAEAIDKGDTPAQAMRRQPDVYPEFYASMVEAADSSPSLLDALSHWLERADRLRERLLGALFYPLLLLDLALVELILFAEWVMPSTLLPMAGPSVAPLLGVLISTHAFTCLVAVAMVVLNVAAIRGGGILEPLARRLPFAAPLRRMAEQALWLRSMGCLLSAGVPLVLALRESGMYLGLAARVERGESLSAALKDVDPFLSWAAQAGEDREDLASALLTAADSLDARVDRRCDVMVRMAQPWALMLVGVFVAGALLAFWGPFVSLVGQQ